ncbi:hypothetical protein GF406_20140 [candidate division KSB1 bacterium]|nr:hypothetical protein [candidate division KSB1 bacterium]
MADTPKLTSRAKEMFAIIEKYKSSEQTQKEFCKNESITYSTFHWWMNQYRKRNNTHSTTKNNDKHPNHFLPISFKPSNSSHGISDKPVLTIEYPNGIILHFYKETDLNTISQLIRLQDF